MKRTTILVLLAAALMSSLGWAGDVMNNKHGTAAISNSGLVSQGSQLVFFEGLYAPQNGSLGSVTFTTGALTSGSLAAGGTFSHVDSTFVVAGDGVAGAPKGLIFAGHFDGQIHWRLISQTGQKLVFQLYGNITGVLYTGETVSFDTNQTITTSVQQLAQGVVHIIKGKVISY